ncbi:helix-turn-helix domain-containing protein [Defluviitalea phaphyphila]|uniref:helix-turn-helix domain-containing protein n=1 Tax=Defluviitalea phaphyphila TaxID=1473580 RepID=UPI0009FDE84C
MAKRYEEEFKKQIVSLYNNGKSLAEISREYKIAKSTVKVWIERYNKTESFNINDNRTEEKKEIIALRKRLKELEMEYVNKMIFYLNTDTKSSQLSSTLKYKSLPTLT